MALDKAIKSGKEHRKPYYGSKAIDKYIKDEQKMLDKLKEWQYNYIIKRKEGKEE